MRISSLLITNSAIFRRIVAAPFVALLCVAVLALSACGDSNPLLGKWVLDKSSTKNYTDRQLLKAIGNDHFVFEETRVTSGNKSLNVTYSVNGDAVTVSYTGLGGSNTYEIIGGDHFVVEVLKLGNLKYVRAAPPK